MLKQRSAAAKVDSDDRSACFQDPRVSLALGIGLRCLGCVFKVQKPFRPLPGWLVGKLQSDVLLELID